MEEREGAGLAQPLGSPCSQGAGQPKTKGTKEVTTHHGRWGDEKTDPAVLQSGVGVLGREGPHLSSHECSLWAGC